VTSTILPWTEKGGADGGVGDLVHATQPNPHTAGTGQVNMTLPQQLAAAAARRESFSDLD